jgi:PP-loop superfamily ATP-utilizing enzyme
MTGEPVNEVCVESFRIKARWVKLGRQIIWSSRSVSIVYRQPLRCWLCDRELVAQVVREPFFAPGEDILK